jgi:hypothetical protein
MKFGGRFEGWGTDSRPFNWDDPGICDAIVKKYLDSISPVEKETGATVADFASMAWEGVTFFPRVGASVLSFLSSGFSGSAAKDTFDEVTEDWKLDKLTDLPGVVKKSMGDMLTESQEKLVHRAMGVLAANTWAERLSGAPMSYIGMQMQYALQFAAPQYLPSQAALDSGFLRRAYTEDEWECLTRANGNLPETHRKSLYAGQTLPTIGDWMANWRRGLTSDAGLDYELRRQGVLDKAIVEKFKEMGQYVPPPSDLINFAVKDVFTRSKLGLDLELAEYQKEIGLPEAFAAQGIVPITIMPRDPDAFRLKAELAGGTSALLRQNPDGSITLDTPAAYWAAHYREAAPGQVMDMYHRLRPGRERLYPLTDEKGTITYPVPLTITDVRRYLREVDYNPFWRDRLAAISYRPINRIDVRRIYSTGAFGPPLGDRGWNTNDPGRPIPTGVAEKELVEAYRDLGYSPNDATRQARYVSLNWQTTSQGKQNTSHLNAICQAYDLGALTYDQAINEVTLVTGDQLGAERFVSVCDIKATNKLLSYAVSAIRARYERAEINELQATGLLSGIGVTDSKTTKYLRMWRLKRERGDREATAAQLGQWYERALVSRTEYRDRLVNLRYSETDANRIIARTEEIMAERLAAQAAKAAKAAAAAEDKKSKAAEKSAREAARLAAQALARFLAARSDQHLKDWWKAGEIDEATIRETLALKGYDPLDIDRWVATYAT